jgi:hypothetical protein
LLAIAPGTGQHRRSTDRAVVDVVRDLARAQSDGDIARVLNRLGYRTGAGNTWTAPRVLGQRRHHGIAAFERTSDRRSVLTIAKAASTLGVSAGRCDGSSNWASCRRRSLWNMRRGRFAKKISRSRPSRRSRPTDRFRDLRMGRS